MSLTQLLELKVKETQKAYRMLVMSEAVYAHNQKHYQQLLIHKWEFSKNLGKEGATAKELQYKIACIESIDAIITQWDIQLMQKMKQYQYYELLYTKAKTNEAVIKTAIEKKRALEIAKNRRWEVV